MVDSYSPKYVQTQAYVVLHKRLEISVDVCLCVSCVRGSVTRLLLQ